MLILFLFSQAMLAQAPKLPEGITQQASVEGITEYLLEDNGLRILLFPDNSKPTVTANVTYLVGSRHEGYGETGMAHLLEHLVFKARLIIPIFHKNSPSTAPALTGRPGTTAPIIFETFSATGGNLRWALIWKPTGWSTLYCRQRPGK